MSGHEPSVGHLGHAVKSDCLLQGFDGRVRSTEALLQFGQAQVGVEGAAVQVGSDRLGPQVLGVGGEVAAVAVDGGAQGFARGAVVARPGCGGERDLEVPQVAGNGAGFGPVDLAGLDEDLEVGVTDASR